MTDTGLELRVRWHEPVVDGEFTGAVTGEVWFTITDDGDAGRDWWMPLDCRADELDVHIVRWLAQHGFVLAAGQALNSWPIQPLGDDAERPYNCEGQVALERRP
jgi:hypothetical protein